jgi:hypothetical protein
VLGKRGGAEVSAGFQRRGSGEGEEMRRRQRRRDRGRCLYSVSLFLLARHDLLYRRVSVLVFARAANRDGIDVPSLNPVYVRKSCVPNPFS